MTEEMHQKLERKIEEMANRALRTLMLCHVDFESAKDLPNDWRENPPDNKGLCCDCIVGIIDPLRSDVKEAVKVAQRAGVIVRMVTGDNIHTASAIARQCGILTPTGIALEGPEFRNMTPKELDLILPNLQVLARSSPEDKYLLVTRLNGFAIPANEEEWLERHKEKIGVTWEKDRDRLLPGYKDEWLATRPDGGQIVGVTGDGTNDAPALKGADVGLAMGISGTKVAQGAADVVILDDKFSSIVKAIMWGRTVYDNIRKFLQFQLTVNVVALLLVFIGAVAGFGQPLNAVMMLWVNLIMDTLGALALGTEPPNPSILNRKPYKRNTSLISRPMARNIICQSSYQLLLCLVLLFKGAQWFNVKSIETLNTNCFEYYVLFKEPMTGPLWDLQTMARTTDVQSADVSCSTFIQFCPDYSDKCYDSYSHFFTQTNMTTATQFSFINLQDFSTECLQCKVKDYTHGTIIFNAFIFCQVCI
jgi:Ca2+-transporting ATPase